MTGKNLDNTQGVIQSQGNATLDIHQQIENQQGKLLSGQNLNVNTQQLNNTSGVIQGLNNVELAVKQQIENQQGWIKANENLDISAQCIDNKNTYILIGHKMQGYERAVLDISKELHKKFNVTAIVPKYISEDVKENLDNNQDLA